MTTPSEYVAQAMHTMPPELFFGDKATFTSGQMFAALMAASKAGNDIDPIKKAIVYGRPIPNDATHKRAKTVAAPKGVLPEGVIHGIVGMISESGELADLLLATWFGNDTPLDKTNLREELGDILWYMARVLDTMQKLYADEDWSFEAMMAGNLGKLRLRHDPAGAGGVAFNPNAHDHAKRDKDAERKAIEDAGAGVQEGGGQTGEPLESQIARLAAFIMKNVEGEPVADLSAVDTAIMVMTASLRVAEEYDNRITQLKKTVDLARADTAAYGNPYLRGLTNGLILALATMTGESEPVLIDAPDDPPLADDGVHKQSSGPLSSLASGVLHRTSGTAPWLEEDFDAPRLVRDARRLAGSVMSQDETAGQG